MNVEELPNLQPAADWTLEETNFDPERIVLNGSKFVLGNGYMGYRGTLEEFGSKQLVANIIAGIYDKVGDAWREPINAPNALFMQVFCDGVPLSVLETPIERHRQALHLREACHRRETVFVVAGNQVILTAERFLSMDNRHLMAMEVTVKAGQNALLEIETGIDLEVWDINGPHLEAVKVETKDHILSVRARTHELGCEICVVEAVEWEEFEAAEARGKQEALRRISFQAEAGREYKFRKYVAIYTGNDGVGSVENAAREGCAAARCAGYRSLFAAHAAAWERRWKNADVEIEGDAEARFALRYSIYHLLAIAPPPDKSISIPARGLSGQVYKGAVFWDTEMFMFPFFLCVEPDTARNLLQYRVRTLDGARRKAREYGYEGAFYAWESQEAGDDACTLYAVSDVFSGRPMRTYFRDKQIHISAAIVYALWKYYEQTGDKQIFIDGGAEVVLECARFYRSHAYYKSIKGRQEFLDVTGPDEYHERVHNDAYTNRMVLETFDTALRVIDLLEVEDREFVSGLIARLDLDGLKADLLHLREDVFIPAPAPETGVIPQFDGYPGLEDISVATLKSRITNPTEYLGGGNGLALMTQIIKQADVVLMLSLFGNDYSREVKRQNWMYYEPRTEHGSSLSACAYGIVACEIGELERAYNFFLQTATIDLTGKSKQYIGPLYIGGTHPAANGGAWMVAVKGFAGLRVTGEGLSLDPRLPARWQKLRFSVFWHGLRFAVLIAPGEVCIEADPDNSGEAVWRICGVPAKCGPGGRITRPIAAGMS